MLVFAICLSFEFCPLRFHHSPPRQQGTKRNSLHPHLTSPGGRGTEAAGCDAPKVVVLRTSVIINTPPERSSVHLEIFSRNLDNPGFSVCSVSSCSKTRGTGGNRANRGVPNRPRLPNSPLCLWAPQTFRPLSGGHSPPYLVITAERDDYTSACHLCT